MAKYVYPAIFELNELGGYCVSFPDLDNIFTHGEDFPNAMEMAEDALCLMLYDMEKKELAIPQASKPSDVQTNSSNIVNLVTCDTRFYKNYFEGKSVKINATIPLWLKEAGEKKHVNFSAILQNGLREYLQL
jgi:predicted RNase H-like HicB family nuclease